MLVILENENENEMANFITLPGMHVGGQKSYAEVI